MALRGGPLRSSASAVGVPGWRVEDLFHFETDFLEEGVVQSVGGALAVTQRGAGANMSVDVATGLALIEFTTTLLSPNATLKSWLNNDATINVAVPTADLTNPRKDRIVAKFDVSVDPNTVASNIVSIELIQGTPAGSPSAPAEPSNAITLAIVDVPASDTAITDSQITDSRPFVTVDSTVLADLQRAATAITKTRAAFNDFTEKTIASGAITVDQVLHTVDTEANAASDDLDTITAAVGSGEMVHLKADNTARTVVIKHGTGNIKLADAADFSLDDTEKSITLIRKSTEWHELARGRGAITTGHYVQPVFISTTTSAVAGQSSGALATVNTHQYTIPANWLATGNGIAFEIEGNININSGHSLDFYLQLGGASAVSVTITPSANGGFVARGMILGTAAAGGSVAVRSGLSINQNTNTNAKSAGNYNSANFATNGTLTLDFAVQYSGSSINNGLTITMSRFDKFSTTAF